MLNYLFFCNLTISLTDGQNLPTRLAHHRLLWDLPLSFGLPKFKLDLLNPWQIKLGQICLTLVMYYVLWPPSFEDENILCTLASSTLVVGGGTKKLRSWAGLLLPQLLSFKLLRQADHYGLHYSAVKIIASWMWPIQLNRVGTQLYAKHTVVAWWWWGLTG